MLSSAYRTADEIYAIVSTATVPELHALGDAELQRAFATFAEGWPTLCDMPDMGVCVGWNVFNTDHILSCGVERCDEAGIFVSDEDALRCVVEQSMHPAEFVAKAATLMHAMANEWRRRTWGAEYVNSRTGPQPANGSTT